MRSRRKRTGPAGLMVGMACAAAMLLGSTGSAVATVTCQSPGYASGDAFQSIAQVETWLTSSGWDTHSSCSSAPTSSSMIYSHTSAGQALDEFGNNTGELNGHEDSVAFESATGTKDEEGQVLDWFVGTTDPPTTAQLEHAQTAAGAGALTEMTIPVAQSTVAVLLSLPIHCKVQSGSAVDIDNPTLGQLWEGTNAKSGEDPGGVQAQGGYAIGTWGALFHQLGYEKITKGTPEVGQVLDEGGANGCEQALKLQVSSNLSGTAYVFKSYLNQINTHVWSSYATDAKTWPSTAVVESDPLSSGGGSQSNDTEGHISENTAATPGSVAFAGIAAAREKGHGAFTNAVTSSTFGTGKEGKSTAHQIVWAEVQNNGTKLEGASYADPLLPASSIANCESTKILSGEQQPESRTASWHGNLASDPNIADDAGSTLYPMCAITYDLVWHHYSAKKLFGTTEAAHNIANAVKDLLEYITNQGQIDIQGHGYTRYPTGYASWVKLALGEIEY